MNDVYKRMVFHFFAGEDFETNTANLIHYRCLNHYQDIFDEININISVNDTSNAEFCNRVKTKLIQVLDRCKNIHFKIVQNNSYCEVSTLYDEVLMKLKDLSGLTFFGHNKGTTNFDDSSCVKKSVADWICGLYYFSLNYPKDVEHKMINDGNPFYGPYLLSNEKISNKHHIYYTGTFYWLNCSKIHRDFVLNNTSIPNLDARGYAEEFPGNFYSKDELGRYNDTLFWHLNMYVNSESASNICFYTEKEKEEYYSYKDKMLKDIKL